MRRPGDRPPSPTAPRARNFDEPFSGKGEECTNSSAGV